MKSPWHYLLISTKATTDSGNDRTDNVIENWTISDSSLFTNPQWTGFSQSSWEESLYLEFRVCHIVVYKPKSRTLALQKNIKYSPLGLEKYELWLILLFSAIYPYTLQDNITDGYSTSKVRSWTHHKGQRKVNYITFSVFLFLLKRHSNFHFKFFICVWT